MSDEAFQAKNEQFHHQIAQYNALHTEQGLSLKEYDIFKTFWSSSASSGQGEERHVSSNAT